MKKLNAFYLLVILSAYCFVSTSDFNEAVNQAQIHNKHSQKIADGGSY